MAKWFAGVAELADALDLGSSVPDVQVQVLLPAWNLRARNAEKSMFLALFSLPKTTLRLVFLGPVC